MVQEYCGKVSVVNFSWVGLGWVVCCRKDAKMAHLDEKTTELVGIQGISSLCNKLLGMCDYHDTKYVLLISGE